MSKVMRLFANQVAKEVVYEALKQYPRVYLQTLDIAY